MAPHVWCLVFEGAMPSTLAHDDFRYVSQLATWSHPSPGFADRVTFIDGSMSLLIRNMYVLSTPNALCQPRPRVLAVCLCVLSSPTRSGRVWVSQERPP